MLCSIIVDDNGDKMTLLELGFCKIFVFGHVLCLRLCIGIYTIDHDRKTPTKPLNYFGHCYIHLLISNTFFEIHNFELIIYSNKVISVFLFYLFG